MHYVYLIEFLDRKDRGDVPYLYIGSKSNSTFDGENILDAANRPYFGSSSFPGYSEICEKERKTVYILGEFESYQECLNRERDIHIELDVVADIRYFNLSVATFSTYSNPGYRTVRHNMHNDYFVRLPKDHPKILSGEYVNTNSGYKTYNNGNEERQFHESIIPGEEWELGRIQQNILYGENNGFYGKTHTEETKRKIIDSRNKTYEDDPDRYNRVIEKLRSTCSNTFKGVPKSEVSNRKRARPGLIILKNSITGECVRVSKIESEKYDKSIWVNPATLSTPSGLGSRWCTNGTDNIKLKPDQLPPIGYHYGRTNKRKTR